MKKRADVSAQMEGLTDCITIRYAWYSIWGPESDLLVWGSINDQTIDLGQKKKMFESLKQEGPQQAKGDTVIKIMMRKSWYGNEVMEKISGTRIMEVPLMRLSEVGKEAEKNKELKPLEGLERKGGVELWVQWMKEDLKTTEERVIKNRDFKDKNCTTRGGRKMVRGAEGGVEGYVGTSAMVGLQVIGPR